MNIFGKLLTKFVINKRAPDEIVGGADDPYLERWFLIKKGWINLYLHRFLRSDDDRALHDHPGDNISMIVDGSYREWMPWDESTYEDDHIHTFEVRNPGQVIYRKAEKLHRIELFKTGVYSRHIDKREVEQPVLTLFWRFKRRREWGFQCVSGWMHWSDFGKRGCS